MVEPAKNSIWIYLIPLWQLEQVSSTFGRRGVEVSLTSHFCMKAGPPCSAEACNESEISVY